MQAEKWRVTSDHSQISRNNLTSEFSESRTVAVDLGETLMEYRPSRWILANTLVINACKDSGTTVRVSGHFRSSNGRLGKRAEPSVDPAASAAVQEILTALDLAH